MAQGLDFLCLCFMFFVCILYFVSIFVNFALLIAVANVKVINRLVASTVVCMPLCVTWCLGVLAP
jgi:hypothetical protein